MPCQKSLEANKKERDRWDPLFAVETKNFRKHIDEKPRHFKQARSARLLHRTKCMAGLLNPHYRGRQEAPIYIAAHNKGDTDMRTRQFAQGVGDFFDTLGSAIAVSAAVRNRRPARASDLARLGIDAERFRQMNRY